MADDSCTLRFSETFPLTRDADGNGPCTTECDSGDWSAEVREGALLQEVKQKLDDDVCRLSTYTQAGTHTEF